MLMFSAMRRSSSVLTLSSLYSDCVQTPISRKFSGVSASATYRTKRTLPLPHPGWARNQAARPSFRHCFTLRFNQRH